MSLTDEEVARETALFERWRFGDEYEEVLATDVELRIIRGSQGYCNRLETWLAARAASGWTDEQVREFAGTAVRHACGFEPLIDDGREPAGLLDLINGEREAVEDSLDTAQRALEAVRGKQEAPDHPRQA